MNRLVVDSGRSAFRCLYQGKRVEFPAVIGRGKKFMMAGRKTGLDALAITFEGEDWLVGQLALDEDPLCSQARVKDKTANENTIIQLAAGAGYVLPKDSEVELIINYNIRDYLNYRDKFSAQLQRAFQVTFTRGELAGMTKYFRFPRVKVIPEGVGAFMYAVFDANGDVKRSDLASGYVLLVDVGSQTCNIALFNKVDMVEEKSWAWDLGMHRAEVELADLLSQKYEYEVTTLAELGDLLDRKTLRIGRRLEILNQPVADILSNHARKIDEAISTKIDDTDRKKITHVILSGGGARCLYAHFQPFWSQTEVEVMPDNRWANCLGQEILAGFLDG
jgi:hypothetical protein